ncbi:unnamed protein product [Cuscuta epithymum]|uniref:ACB domain-containing protein n=1 Tax=Cuscuta epithymum TaxID=186058 RepID=A0AAV0GAX4_9ASTE|nr:unnamed protein product [Cuscuta epithymum]
MGVLEGYYMTALLALLFSCIIAKLFSDALSSDVNKTAESSGVVAAKRSSIDHVKMADQDAGQVLVKKSQKVEQCLDASDGGFGEQDSKNIEFSEDGAVTEKVRASKLDAFRSHIEGERTMTGETGVVGTGGGFREDDEDQDWEGIERSELEMVFGKAVNLVECGGDEALSNLGTELQMQLYGLQKVAMEGPCFEPQPMVFRVSARSKWNAWQRLGSMSSEVAMEQYVKLVSDSVPDWDGCVSTSETVKGDDPGNSN